MAGSKVAMPANASTDWSDFVTITQHSYRSFQFVGLSGHFTTGVPAIEEGSYAVVNGTMYNLTPSTGGSETISTTGLSTGFTEGELWIKAVPSTGTSITCEFTTDDPVWRTNYGGFYGTSGGTTTHRYLGGVYKSTGRYAEAWLYGPTDRRERPILKVSKEIGIWDMNTDAQKTVALGGAIRERVTGIIGTISIDTDIGTGDYSYTISQDEDDGDIRFFNSTDNDGAMRGSNIYIYRPAAGRFDSTQFSSTVSNRGWVTIFYKG
jgi:hypothetical protein